MSVLSFIITFLLFEGIYWLGWWMGRRSLMKYKRIIDDVMGIEE